ncbi:MAG: hypothetical protein K8R88_15795, partial [Armatimonadetes bacterium]|nr:hypothetical protein [Armatimonadota bacterium]
MFKQHVRRTVVFTILGVLAAFILAKLTRSVFEANLEMILGEQSLGRTVNQSPFSPEVEKILNKASTQSAETERQIISSASTFFGAVSKVSDRTRNRELMADFQDLYKMYNIESARVNTQEEAAAVVSVKVRAYDVKDAKAIALEVANVYNDQRKETATKAVADAVAFLESQIPSAQKDLQAKEDLTTKYKEESGVQDLDVNLRELVGARSTLETTRDSLKRQIQSGEAQLSSLSGKASALPERVAESSSEQIDSRILQLEGQLQELTSRRLQLLAIYLADAPEVKKVDEQIKARNA